MADALPYFSSANRSTMGDRLSAAYPPMDGSRADEKRAHFVLGAETEAAFTNESDHAAPHAVGCPQHRIVFDKCYISTSSLTRIYCRSELDRRMRNMRNQIENHYTHVQQPSHGLVLRRNESELVE